MSLPYTDYMVVVEGNATITIGGTVKNNAKNPNGQAGEWLGRILHRRQGL